ncbi:restriction endonuclease subunit S [Sulfurimonas sp. NWX367]|uniref:restriction endonuclease subunit S n=1 Tax=Sulfurimonas sp. NWX367 TaxID=2925413 RepID=UPI003204F936
MSELYELPEGWEWKQLDDISKLIGGGTPKRNMNEYWDNGNIVWLSPTDLGKIGDIIYISDSKDKITQQGLDKSSAKLLPVGTVLYSSRATIGKIAINTIEVSTNQGFTNFICNENLNNRYLAYILSRFTPEITSLSNSTTFKEVSKTSLKKFQIPLPPLQEQKRIVAKLDTLFEKIDKAIALHQKNMDEADVLMGSVLNEVFGGMEEKYGKTQILSVMKINNQTLIPDDDKMYNYIGLENIESNSGKLVNYAPSIGKDIKSSKVNFKKGMVLYGKLRPYLNKVWIADFDGIATTEILPFLPIDNNLSMKYVKHYFLSPKYLAKVMSNCSGARMPRLTTKFIKSNEAYIPVPSLNIQQKTVAYLDKISQKIEKLKAVQKEKMQSLVALKASILDQAFRGEL